jgi:phage terminase small subunit
MPKKRKTGRKKNNITPKHKKFIDFYIESDNATEAYKKAGYKGGSAGVSSWNLLKKPYIQQFLSERRTEVAKTANIKAQDVINELAKIAFANSEDFFEWDETVVETNQGEKKISRILIKEPALINRDKKAAIAGIKETSQGGLEFKFHDKIKALENLSKYFGTSNDAEIKKAKAIKSGIEEKTPDPTEGYTEEDIDKRLKELGDD